MRHFEYSRPTSLADAQKILREDPEAKALAGGQSLLPVLRMRLAAPTRLVDLQDIRELRGVSVRGRTVSIAAMTTHAEIGESADVQRAAAGLAMLAGGVGDPMVRNMGTIGGAVANNDPAADYPGGLLGLDAVVVTTGRRIAAADFFTGLYETALEAGELVTAVEFNAPRRAAYAKFRHPASGFAIVGAFVAETDKGPRVAITGAGATAFRVPAYEQALARSFRPESLAGVSAEFDSLNSDRHAPAEYRASLIPEMVRRALVLALQS
ncbi:MAG TPA: xanthine dehydrogenase family protein subunit M [Patescibacteria group bacterium]|nr:xanthine dehydrogenase family protein subunit M [Patescibacteria group bacterium]